MSGLRSSPGGSGIQKQKPEGRVPAEGEGARGAPSVDQIDWLARLEGRDVFGGDLG